jgi:hypothetical protein
MTSHDAAYRQLFSNPLMLISLLRHFLGETLAAEIDLEASDKLEHLNSVLFGEDDRRRESDMVWRIPLKNGESAYRALLITNWLYFFN